MNGFGDDVHGSEPRRGYAREHQLNGWVETFPMQFRNAAKNIIGDSLPLRVVGLLLMFHVAFPKSTPQIREIFADLSPVASETPDDFGA